MAAMATRNERASSPEPQLTPNSKANTNSPEPRSTFTLCSNACCPYNQTVVVKCEKCQQESMGEISSSSELPSITTSDLANSVISLLRGAGLLDNLTKIVEKTRTQDEHLLTDKLEMVKVTNSDLESSEKEIGEKNSRIERMTTELEELKQQVQQKTEERERLFCKRKLLNEECNTLQKKLHCCDSLLKVVPKVNSDSSIV